MITARQIVLDAADLLAANHWARGTYHAIEERGGKIVDCFCAEGAIYQAAAKLTQGQPVEIRSAVRPAARRAMAAMDLLALKESERVLIRWNDDVAKTKRQVVAFLRRGARGMVNLEKRRAAP